MNKLMNIYFLSVQPNKILTLEHFLFLPKSIISIMVQSCNTLLSIITIHQKHIHDLTRISSEVNVSFRKCFVHNINLS